MDNDQASAEGDTRIPLSSEERSVRASLAVVVVTTAAYLTVITGRLLDRPVEEVSWVPTLLWTLGISIGVAIVGTVIAQIVGQLRTRKGGGPVLHADQRDKEIKRVGSLGPLSVLGR